MGPILKSKARTEFIAEIDRLERKSDECYQGLELLRYPENLASWAALTHFIQTVESTIAREGQYSRQVDAVMLNLARSGALLFGWIQEQSRGKLVPISRLKWNDNLGRAAAAAFNTAHNYETFRGCFPAWHKFQAMAEFTGPNQIRIFTNWRSASASGERVPKGIPPQHSTLAPASPNFSCA